MSTKAEFYEAAVKLIAEIDASEALCTRQEAEAEAAHTRMVDYFIGKRAVALHLQKEAAELRALCDGERKEETSCE